MSLQEYSKEKNSYEYCFIFISLCFIYIHKQQPFWQKELLRLAFCDFWNNFMLTLYT